MQPESAFWRTDIDSLAFHLHEHEQLCVIHRLAFRALLGFEPTAQQCQHYFQQRTTQFIQAANKKIARLGTVQPANFHLTSRDVRRAFAENAAAV